MEHHIKFLKFLSLLQKHGISYVIYEISFSSPKTWTIICNFWNFCPFSINVDYHFHFLNFFSFSIKVGYYMQFLEFLSLLQKHGYHMQFLEFLALLKKGGL